MVEVNINSKGDDLHWRPIYWIAAAAIPMVFFCFQSLTNYLYPETRALNASLAIQLAAMLFFYALWAVIPMLIWKTVRANIVNNDIFFPPVFKKLFIIGGICCALHLLLLAFILRLLYSPPGWGVQELAYSFGEVCLSNAAIWLTAFCVAALTIIFFINAKIQVTSISRRYEIRQNGKIWPIDFAEIYWIKAAGNYAEFHTVHGVMMVRKSLAQVRTELNDGNFVQSHRSALVNGQHVVAIKPEQKGDSYLVELANADSVPLSRRNHRDFRTNLQSIRKI